MKSNIKICLVKKKWNGKNVFIQHSKGVMYSFTPVEYPHLMDPEIELKHVASVGIITQTSASSHHVRVIQVTNGRKLVPYSATKALMLLLIILYDCCLFSTVSMFCKFMKKLIKWIIVNKLCRWWIDLLNGMVRK